MLDKRVSRHLLLPYLQNITVARASDVPESFQVLLQIVRYDHLLHAIEHSVDCGIHSVSNMFQPIGLQGRYASNRSLSSSQPTFKRLHTFLGLLSCFHWSSKESMVAH